MLLMFGVFAVLFFIDGSTGYRKKNLTFHLRETFRAANDEFIRLDKEGLDAARWKEFASKQQVALPDDPALVPADLPRPLPWPEPLQDYERMRQLQWNRMWLDYSGREGLDATKPEKPYDSRQIREQWVFFWICLVLTLGALSILLRTLGRSIRVDTDSVTGPGGLRVPFADLTRLDLRKWDSKGLAYLDYEGGGGKGRIRIDGLTYGGFKAEQGEPASRLMERIRAGFSGEIVEYAPVAPARSSGDGDAGGGDSGGGD